MHFNFKSEEIKIFIINKYLFIMFLKLFFLIVIISFPTKIMADEFDGLFGLKFNKLYKSEKINKLYLKNINQEEDILKLYALRDGLLKKNFANSSCDTLMPPIRNNDFDIYGICSNPNLDTTYKIFAYGEKIEEDKCKLKEKFYISFFKQKYSEFSYSILSENFETLSKEKFLRIRIVPYDKILDNFPSVFAFNIDFYCETKFDYNTTKSLIQAYTIAAKSDFKGQFLSRDDWFYFNGTFYLNNNLNNRILKIQGDKSQSDSSGL